MRNLFKLSLIIAATILMAGCGNSKKLTKALNNPEDLTKLKIKYAKIDELPADISRLKDLKTLYLFKNNLKELPEEIGQLTNLEYLYIDDSIILPYSINNVNPRLQVIIKERGQLN